MATLPQAYAFAARAHTGQFRKGAGQVPYINHPCAVAALVDKAGSSEAAIMAAVLHDVVEDTSVTLAEIESAFGAEVAGLVDALTDTPEMEALTDGVRKTMQAEKITHAPVAAKLVKLADQTNNLQDMCGVFSNKPLAVRKAYLAGARAIASQCAGLSGFLDEAFAVAACALQTMIDEEEQP